MCVHTCVCVGTQLTLKQRELEQHRPTYPWVFFSKSLYCFLPVAASSRRGGPTVRIDLHNFMQGTRASADWGIHRAPGTSPPWILRDNSSFGRVKSDMQISDCICRGRPPNPPGVFKGRLHVTLLQARHCLSAPCVGVASFESRIKPRRNGAAGVSDWQTVTAEAGRLWLCGL